MSTTSSMTTTHPTTSSSSWHSPVPYLFGGLAAMLGLIAFALLILACSYWKLSGQLQNEENHERDLESGEKQSESETKEPVKVYEEKILVIMAGDEKPTFLATPACSKSSSFPHGDDNHNDTNLRNHVTCQKSQKDLEQQQNQQE
ncbi:hypothetical protein RJT34_10400 [Clitoria ternatea]|uniref:Uncharacterized protein n=1 Tax=Clitoria ternatea TaxID=43366 RepID=A0AAN9K6N7_CLITE